MTQAPPSIALHAATFGYRGVPVVREVDLDLRAGSFLGVLGQNGAGKTTLLRGLLGLLAPLSGRVERRGVRLGYVPQRETLDAAYPLTVEEVVTMGVFGRLRPLRAPSRDEREFVHECLRRVSLLERRAALFSSLSGGQRQRALIARALAMRPNVLVLDEPTSGVDQRAQEVVLDLLSELNQHDRMTILLVSHELATIRMVEEVLWVADGRVTRGTRADMLRPERLEELFGVPVRAEGGAG